MSSGVSTLTDKERHDIILETLSSFDKGAECFKNRWTESDGGYLTGEILLETPMFWFMRYKWSKEEIETLFYKAQVVIDEKFDTALLQTFGGKAGARWKGGGGVRPCKKPKDDEDAAMNYHINHPDFDYNPVIQPVDFQMTGNRKPKQGGKLNDFLNDVADGIDDQKKKSNEDDDDGSDFETDPENEDDDDSKGGDDLEAITTAFSMNDLDRIRTSDDEDSKKKRKQNTHTPTISRGVTITTGNIRMTKTPTSQKLKRQAGASRGIGNKSRSEHIKGRSAQLQWEWDKQKAIEKSKEDGDQEFVTKLKF